MKTLYFEGAGCVPRGEVENCRIRTAFTNNEGRQIYLEIMGVDNKKYNKPTGYIDSCHYITGKYDDENKNSIQRRNGVTFEYTKENILKTVNSLGCNFESVVILPDLAGYRVFKDKEGYNFGDEFEFNAELTAKREAIKKHFYDLEKSEYKQYPNFSLWTDTDNVNILHLLRHFNGYNKHWNININGEGWSIEETKLNKYAC